MSCAERRCGKWSLAWLVWLKFTQNFSSPTDVDGLGSDVEVTALISVNWRLRGVGLIACKLHSMGAPPSIVPRLNVISIRMPSRALLIEPFASPMVLRASTTVGDIYQMSRPRHFCKTSAFSGRVVNQKLQQQLYWQEFNISQLPRRGVIDK